MYQRLDLSRPHWRASVVKERLSEWNKMALRIVMICDANNDRPPLRIIRAIFILKVEL